MLEANEIPEYQSVWSIAAVQEVAGTTGSRQTLCAAGHHPKCRLVRGDVITLAWGAADDSLLVEDGDGNDASDDLDQHGTVHGVTSFTPIPGQVFERNEAIMLLRTVGNAANASITTVTFESIH